MNLLPRWIQITAEAADCAPRASEPDPGDMGTAFGLDASFESVEPAPPPPTPEKKTGSTWSQRLVRRPRR